MCWSSRKWLQYQWVWGRGGGDALEAGSQVQCVLHGVQVHDAVGLLEAARCCSDPGDGVLPAMSVSPHCTGECGLRARGFMTQAKRHRTSRQRLSARSLLHSPSADLQADDRCAGLDAVVVDQPLLHRRR